MQKWEYRFVAVPDNFYDIETITKDSTSKQPIDKFLKILGNEGWELAGILRRKPEAKQPESVFFFKRPLEVEA